MPETPKQYVARILSYLGRRDPLRVQRATPAKLARLARGLSRRQLLRRPAPRKWSIGEILAHMADVELGMGFRIRMILSQNGVRLQPFDQNRWAADAAYARLDPRKSLALFAALREANLRLLRSVPRRKLRNYGFHPERGKETVAFVCRLVAGHDLNHLLQVRRLRR